MKKPKITALIPLKEIKTIKSIFNVPAFMNRSSPSESDFEKMMESHLELYKQFNKLNEKYDKLLKEHNQEMGRL